jgi:hypothetical protein
LLLVHPEIAQLNQATALIDRHYRWPQLAVSQALSSALPEIPAQKRPFRTPSIFTEKICDYGSGPLLCTDIALLFEPALQLDPLQLFLTGSKTTCLIIAWPGMYQNGTLAYAIPEHAHHRIWTALDLCDYCVLSL